MKVETKIAEVEQPAAEKAGSDLGDFFAKMASHTDDTDSDEFDDGTQESTSEATASADDAEGEADASQAGEGEGEAEAASGESTDAVGEEEEGTAVVAQEVSQPPEQSPVTETPTQPEVTEPTVEAREPEQPTSLSAEEQAKIRKEAVDELARRYEIDAERAELLRAQPEEVLPQLAAEMYLDVYQNVVNTVTQMLPQIMQQVTAQQQQQKAGEDAFFSRWKALNTPEGRAQATRFANVYRQAYPQATQEQFIEEVGLQTMIALRLPIEGVSAPAAQVPVAPRQPAPRTPASTTSIPSDARRGSRNMFESMAEEFLQEEL